MNSEALTELATLEEKEVLINQKTTKLNIVIAIISCGIMAIKKSIQYSRVRDG